MNRLASIFGMSIVAVLCFAAPAAAQEEGPRALIEFSGAFSVGLAVLGAAYGIGKLASAAVESMARQPEVAGNIQVVGMLSHPLDLQRMCTNEDVF